MSASDSKAQFANPVLFMIIAAAWMDTKNKDNKDDDDKPTGYNFPESAFPKATYVPDGAPDGQVSREVTVPMMAYTATVVSSHSFIVLVHLLMPFLDGLVFARVRDGHEAEPPAEPEQDGADLSETCPEADGDERERALAYSAARVRDGKVSVSCVWPCTY